MKLRIAFAAACVTASLAAVPATYAAVSNTHSPVLAMYFHGDKKIKFSLHNQTGAPLELKVGDQVVTLQVNQVMPFKLPAGTRIITNTATTDLKVGDLVFEVYAGMYSDSTLSVK